MNALHEVEAERRAGVAVDVIHRAQVDHAAKHRRPPALTAREALIALQFECLIIWMAAGNIRNGVEMSDVDLERITLAMKRIDAVTSEVAA